MSIRRSKLGTNENSFSIIQPDNGTSPVADSPSDTLTFTSADGSIIITGSASTDTLDFILNDIFRGSTWRDGSGAPSNALGINGDYYLDVVTGDVYEKAAGTYSIQGNIKGPIGATGPQGPAATVAVGTVTTGNAGTNVIINNVGSSTAAVFDFTIPRGDTTYVGNIDGGSPSSNYGGTFIVDGGTP